MTPGPQDRRHPRRGPFRPGARCWAATSAAALVVILAGCSTGTPESAAPGSAGSASAASPSASTSTAPGTLGPSARTTTGATEVAVTVGETTYEAELYDNPTARDLARQLPVTVAMDDLDRLERRAGCLVP